MFIGAAGAFFAVGIIAVVLIARSMFSPQIPVTSPTNAQQDSASNGQMNEVVPTQTSTKPSPTQAAKPTATAVRAPTFTAVPKAKDYYLEEFGSDYNSDDWEYLALGSGSDKDLKITHASDELVFDLGDEDLYVYYMYQPYAYDSVSLTLVAENQGRNNNNVSLVCNVADDDSHWYEFSVESGGLWYLYGVTSEYNVITNGGTVDLKQGMAVNEYGMTCDGNTITLSINGHVLQTITDRTYAFTSGKVGFNISSLNVLPIIVAVQRFEIKKP
jgi:hypothetical protein